MVLFQNISKSSLDEQNKLIRKWDNSDSFVLANSNIEKELRVWTAEQINLKKKAEKKHPSFYQNECFFSKKSLEQSTSEAVSSVKIKLVGDILNSKICDLTGGMGAETFAFAKNGNRVVYVEPNLELFKLTEYNFTKLGIEKNVEFHNLKAEDFLRKNKEKFELILLDPDRRAEGLRDFRLENSSPNPIEIESSALDFCDKLWIKHSPLIDLDFLNSNFQNIQKAFIISYRNEVKEISTLHCKKQGEINSVICVSIDFDNNYKEIVFKLDENISPPEFSEKSEQFFYEPDKSIIKSGFSNDYAERFYLKSLGFKIPYYTSSEFHKDFAGRVFRVIDDFDFSEKNLKKFLKMNEISKASVGARGFVMKANQIEEKFRLKPDDENFLFFYINGKSEKRVVWCKPYLPNSSM